MEKKWCYIAKEGVTNEHSTNDDDEDKDEVFFIAITKVTVEKALITSTSIHKNWIIDSGCLHDMSGNMSKFHEAESYDGGMVKFDNNSPCTVIDEGFVALNESTTYEDV